MESIGIGSIVIVVLVVWYLGSTINNVLAASGEIAEKEFGVFKKAQDMRLRKQSIKLHKQVEKIKDQPVYTDSEWDALFNPERDE